MPDFRFLSSASVLASHYSASASSFPSLPASASQWPPQCSAPAFASSVFPVPSGLISHAFRPGSGTQLPVCFLSSFPASLPQPFHRCLPSAFASGLSPSDPLPFVRFTSGSDYSARCSSVPFFLASPHQRLLQCPAPPLGFPVFHLLLRPVSRASFPASGTWLPVCFLSSLPASLPQLFHRCFPSFPLSLVRFTSGLSACLPHSFVCFGLLLTTQPSALSFPLFPFSPVGGSHGARRFLSSPTLSSSVQPVSMPSFRFRYSASCDSFLRLTASCHRHFTASGLLFPARPSPLLSL